MKKIALKSATLLIFSIQFLSLAQEKSTEMKMSGVKIISAVNVNEKIDGRPARVSMVELTLKPKQTSAPHRHPGPVYGYVLEGTYEFKIEGHPLRLLKPGDTFYEPLMTLHEVGSNPSIDSITKVLATMVHPRDAKRLVIPEIQ